jgi:hypothetical protein
MYGIATLLSGEAPGDYTEQSMYALLQAFGIGAKEARELAYAQVAECPGPRGVIFERVRTPSVEGEVETVHHPLPVTTERAM